MSDPVTPSAPASIKPGYATSEFWLSTTATVFFALLSTGTVFPNTPTWVQITSVIAAALSALGYGQTRSAIKQAAVSSTAMIAIAFVLMSAYGCQTSLTVSTPPDLGRVITAQVALIGVEFAVEDLHSKGKLGAKGYADAIAIEKSAADDLQIAANDARNGVPLTATDQAAISQSFRAVIANAILANNPELANSLEIRQIQTILDEITPATQPGVTPATQASTSPAK